MGKHFVNVSVNYIGSNAKVTFADVDFQILDDDMNEVYYKQTKASAQRNYEDRADELVGVKLALGRAFENLGRNLQKNAWGQVTHQDNLRALKRTKTLKESVELKKG